MIDIIIPTFGQEQFTVKCLESIRKYTSRDSYRIIWVDNGSSKISREIVMSEIINHNYISIWLESNLGFVKATNIGLQASDTEYVILQNNDTEVTEDWLERLQEPLLSDISNVASGPMTSTDGSWQGWRNVKKNLLYDLPDLSLINKEKIPKLLSDKYKNYTKQVKMIAFFCTLFKRKVFNELGLLDEIFGSGFGDDDDFCMRITKAGYNLIFVPSSYVLHHHRTTFKSVYGDTEVIRMQEENLNKFKRKHNLI